MYMYMYIMSKLINVADDVYKLLTVLKGENSYSVLIRELVVKKTNKEALLSFYGKKGVDGKKVKELSCLWKSWSEKYV
jgi:predicted CopG family antitoxin